ncbi:MAG: electron transfer flavoprotein subunit alpha/FixB family protein [Deltaproteobacteria bacterium]|nr:MAG: electron transfer flavoprotein subunit alpha/FixB family protein [Deltaproteobacteria bacterium]
MGNGILVVAEHEGGTIKKTAYELLTKAGELAASIGGKVSALLIGADDPGDLGAYGAGTVYTVTGDAFTHYTTTATVAALQAAIEAADPAVVLAPASPQAKDAFPRLAARLGAGLGTEVTGLEARDGRVVARRPQYAGKAFTDVHIKGDLALFTVRPNSFAVGEATGGSAEVVALSVDVGEPKVKVVDTEAPSGDTVDLTEADRIVSGGRAVKSKENFDKYIRPLAASIGATVGASRAAVDAGYAPHSEQVGQTGKVVNPSLYIAVGISGAIQHLAGMRTSKIIVAINKDPEAPIFQHSTYGIVGDLFDICPLLTEEFQALG